MSNTKRIATAVALLALAASASFAQAARPAASNRTGQQLARPAAPSTGVVAAPGTPELNSFLKALRSTAALRDTDGLRRMMSPGFRWNYERPGIDTRQTAVEDIADDGLWEFLEGVLTGGSPAPVTVTVGGRGLRGVSYQLAGRARRENQWRAVFAYDPANGGWLWAGFTVENPD